MIPAHFVPCSSSLLLGRALLELRLKSNDVSGRYTHISVSICGATLVGESSIYVSLSKIRMSIFNTVIDDRYCNILTPCTLLPC